MGYAENLIKWYQLTLETIASRLSEDNGKIITVDDVGKAIADIFGYTDNTEAQKKIYEEGLGLYEILKDYYFTETIEIIELSDNDRISIVGDDQEITEALVKHKNQKWEIHKNDKDLFPSNPHAHNYEAGLKLDLSNGNLYKKKKKRSSITKKELLQIRQKCTDKGITLPKLSV